MSYRYYNTMEIIGEEKQIQAVKEFIRGGLDEMGQEIYFDFNKVDKMPENWDCTFPPFEQEMKEKNIIRYTTINGRALGIVKKLSTLFPEVILVVESLCDSPDDMICHYKNGEIVKFMDCDYFTSDIQFYAKNKKVRSKIESDVIEFCTLSDEERMQIAINSK